MARYVPILRWKRGERSALQRLTAAGKLNVAPLIVLASEQYKSRAETASKAAVSAADGFIAEVIAAWSTAPFYLDATELGVGSSGAHRIERIAAAARRAGAEMIPATRIDAPTTYQNAVNSIAATDGLGIGLRVDLQELTSASTWARTWIRPLNETDLIADFADNIGTVASLGASVDHAFNSLHRATSWRSVTVAGSSMPANFIGYSSGLHPIRREEWRLWRRLSRAVTAYPIDYGDYATVSPNAPPSGIAWGFPINVRYTLDGAFLICRGVKTTGPDAEDMDVQLLGHARSIRGYATRNALAHCWADARIDRIAARTDTPGNLESWVQIGVNRHIEVVRHRLP